MIEPTIFRGQWGITQDDSGRLYYNTNSNLLLGDYYDAQAIVAAGNRGAPGLNKRISANDEVYSVRVNPGVNRAYLPGVLREDGRLRTATSASGMVVYRGGRFAADDPDAFVAEPAANLVAAFKVRNDGLRVSAEQQLVVDAKWGQRDFLASTDERFRPVDVLNGPDGALYIIDFYRGIIQDHVFLSDELKAQVLERGLDRPLGMGRIWRVAKTEAESAAPQPNWRTMDAQALVAELSSRDIWRRGTAQRLLVRSDSDEVTGRLERLVTSGSPQAAVHGVWTLEGRGELTNVVVQAALARDAAIAEAALLAGGDLLSADEVNRYLSDLLAGSRLYLYALAALRHHINDDSVLATSRQIILQHAEDPHVRAFVLATVRGREAELAQALGASDQWTAEREAKTQTLAKLAQQLLRAEGAGSSILLDYVSASPQPWVQQALLSGLYEATRERGFERAVLSAPHELFSTPDEALWPFVSKARRAFTWEGDDLAADAKPLSTLQAHRMAQGAEFFASSCANCHGADGAGVGALGPPLAASPWVTQAPERLARIVLHGVSGPIEVAGKTWNSAMPGHKDFPGFDDEVASGLLTFLRRSWGHAGRAIEPQFVAQVRAETADRTALWTVPELEAIDINTHYVMYAGQYGRPDAPMSFTYDGKQLVIAAGIFNGPVVELKEDHFLFAPRKIPFEFVVSEDGVVTAVMMPTGDGSSHVLPRVPSE